MMRFVSFLVGSESLIGMMLLIRVLLRDKIPPGILYALWLVPAVRLLIPFTLIPVPVLPEVVGEAAGVDEGFEKAAADHATITENAQDAGREEIGGTTEAFFSTKNGVDMREEAVSPCLFGLFHPCILLSKQTAKNKELCRQALLHEETHYRQKDEETAGKYCVGA